MKKITKRSENYNKWYNELITKSDLAENSEIRGCMIIKPYGYSIWEIIQKELDKILKNTGHKNVYFPLFIPKKYFECEETNAKGFAKECAIVTHYRFKVDPNNNKKFIIDPNSKLEEELIVRPTSEAIIWNSYKKWIESYRDLPILINQWSNVVRWEMRTRFFLRNTEFLWQEGHTAHITKKEALIETKMILNLYSEFIENFMGIPTIKGIKTNLERFAGAEETYSLEALMQDGKALQIATSHFLGQNFSKAFNVKFTSKEGNKKYVWATSWGVSTRLMGALIMTHSDDHGLVLPPKLAPIQVIIIPIYNNNKELIKIKKIAEFIINSFKKNNIRVNFDDRLEYTPGWKFNNYEIKGVPLRIVIGNNELKNQTVEIFRRDTLVKSIESVDFIINNIKNLLNDIQFSIFRRAKKFRDSMITRVNSYKDFKKTLIEKKGFISAHWDGSSIEEEIIKNETQATIRCIPLNNIEENGFSMISKKISTRRVLFAKSY